MSDNKPVRRSPRFAPPIPPASDVNAAQNTAKKSASVASNQSKPLRRSPRLSSAPATANAALARLHAQGIRRSPRLNGSPGPDPGTLPESSRKSGSVKGKGSLGKPETRVLLGNTPRFGSSKIGTTEVTVVEIKRSKCQSLTLNTDEEAEPLSILWHEDGDKLYMPLEYCDNKFFGERHLRRSPRLISATKDNGSDKYMNKFLGDVFNKNHLTSPRLSSSLIQADNIKLDSSFVGLSKSDEHPSKMIITSSGKSDPDENCLRQSPKTSLFGAENGKREYSLIELSESDEKQPPKKFKTPASLEYKQKKHKNMSSFIGDPILDDEAQERWRWRYEMKSQRSKGQCLTKIEDDKDEGDGGQKHVGRILEFFRTTDGENYFRIQWFYRVEDTVIKDEGAFHDKRRLFYSTIMNDNLIDCIIAKVNVTQITPRVGLRLNSIPPSDFFCDMEYCVDYSTFRSLVTDNSVKSHDVSSPDSVESVCPMATPTFLEKTSNGETFKDKLALLDLFSGCGGMSTGLCLGAKLSGVNLATSWALDSDRSACESLRLNHRETHVRNETAEDFLKLLKEWEKLCKRYKVNDLGRTRQSRAKSLRAARCNGSSLNDDEVPTGEYEVSRLVDICYGDPNKIGKHGLNFKVHWKGYSTSKDSWEPIEGLRNCQEMIQKFVKHGLKLKILPLPGDVDVICGGPPCQGISGYNRFRNHDSPLADDRNHQIVVFMDIVKYLKPKYVLMENVVDILRFDKASLGRYALSRLVHMNYQARLGTIAAGCYGLPQFRLRVFLWGAHPSEKLPQFPLPTHDVIVRYWPPLEFERNTVAYDEGQPHKLEKAVVLQDAISDLPAVTNFETREEMSYQKPPETEFQRYIRSTRYEMTGSTLSGSLETKPSIFDHRPYALSEDDYLRVCQIPKRKGANFRDLPGVVVGADNVVRRDPKEQKLLPSGKAMVPDYAFTFEQGKSRRPFARLWWDETVPTVVTFPSCHNQAALHPEQDRVLTIREYARLQGFPDYYRFCGTIKERYCQIGNAVSVPVARALGYALGLSFRKLSRDEPLTTLPPEFSHSNYLQLVKSLSHESN
ncbi:DNA (cytosine-5)-methyltransferase CMT2 isoform X2 [Corylus avellana]|uniref:DNA (cytosine-5)-methyltransferase CMT2 isoform X2 n=1 Tax=Corylus avellana TaxID=13451 RepID=UPI00286CD0B6|nr:DNA (cytosine-5)-methyltransferase CMT2 isoform X2 [Corylus avellana]